MRCFRVTASSLHEAWRAHAVSQNVEATPLATTNAARDCSPHLPSYLLPERICERPRKRQMTPLANIQTFRSTEPERCSIDLPQRGPHQLCELNPSPMQLDNQRGAMERGRERGREERGSVVAPGKYAKNWSQIPTYRLRPPLLSISKHALHLCLLALSMAPVARAPCRCSTRPSASSLRRKSSKDEAIVANLLAAQLLCSTIW